MPLMVFTRVGVQESAMGLLQASPLISTQLALIGMVHISAEISIHDPGRGALHTVEPLKTSGGDVRVIALAPGPGVTITLVEPVILKLSAPSGLRLLIVFTRVGVHE
jgi:hypothetical protein